MTFIYIWLKAICFALVLVSCSDLNKKLNLPDDNVYEESLEFVLKTQTGIDLDFTPSTPEK